MGLEARTIPDEAHWQVAETMRDMLFSLFLSSLLLPSSLGEIDRKWGFCFHHIQVLVGGRCIPHHKDIWNDVRVTKKRGEGQARGGCIKKYITSSFVGIPAWVLLVNVKQGWAGLWNDKEEKTHA